MASRFGILNLCKSKTQIPARDVPERIAGDEIATLASNGCKPVISHQKSSDAAILSKLDAKQLGDDASVQTTTLNQNGTTDVDKGIQSGGFYNPSDTFEGYTAGLSGANPLSVSGTNPFPASGISTTRVRAAINGFYFAQAKNGVPIGFPEVPLDPQVDTSFASGFGSVGKAGFQAMVNLAGIERRAIRWRAFHTYTAYLTLPYTPTMSPLGLLYDSLTDEYRIITSSRVNYAQVGQQGMTECQASVSVAIEYPALTACQGTILPPNSLIATDRNGPLLTRDYCRKSLGSFTCPGYGDSLDIPLDPGFDTRPNLVVYLDDTVGNVSCLTGDSNGSGELSSPIPLAGPGFFAGHELVSWVGFDIPAGTYDLGFVISGVGDCSNPLTTPTANWYTELFLTPPTGGDIVYWEAFAHVESVPL